MMTRSVVSLALVSALVAGCSPNDVPAGPPAPPPPPPAAPPPPAPPSPPLEGTIAFASTRDGVTNDWIYIMNADGTGVTRLIGSDGEADWDPAWSPDGSRIAFVSSHDSARTADILVMNEDGTNLTPLTNGSRNTQPAWCGDRIAFSSDRDPPMAGSGESDIWVMNADGNGVTRLTSAPHLDFSPVWSPTCGQLAFASTRDGTYQLYVINADGTGEKRISDNMNVRDADPAWSPDGSRIAFRREISDNRLGDVYIMNSDGTGVTRLTDNAFATGKPTWSPDGSHIAFTRDINGYWDIYVMNADGSGLTRLTRDPRIDISPAWRP